MRIDFSWTLDLLEAVLRNRPVSLPVWWGVKKGTRETDAQGDLEVLYREHGNRLWRSVWLSTGRPEVADDAVAEAFAQALDRGEELRDPLAWIWRTAFRIAAGEMKRIRRASALVADLPDRSSPSLVEILEALGRLSDRQRAALVLAEYAGYPHREVAGILGTTVSAVAVHVHRARRRMRVLLEENDA
jgi:RNA polymerase sigma-70 factor (ECF subfamily)